MAFFTKHGTVVERVSQFLVAFISISFYLIVGAYSFIIYLMWNAYNINSFMYI